MIRHIKSLYGENLGASDGEIGHVQDVLFDDQCWVVRYLVADTGNWIPGRQVLLSPYAFTPIEQRGKILTVNLTRRQIEESPSLESHHPVSRQYEEMFYMYYGWPFYWQGTGLWGMSNYPALVLPAAPLPPEASDEAKLDVEARSDAHLQSVKAISGYQVYSYEDSVGHVTDFLMDERNWAINHLVVDTRYLLPGRKVLIAPQQIKRISHEDSRIFMKVTKDAILQAPDYDPSSVTGVRKSPGTHQ